MKREASEETPTKKMRNDGASTSKVSYSYLLDLWQFQGVTSASSIDLMKMQVCVPFLLHETRILIA